MRLKALLAGAVALSLNVAGFGNAIAADYPAMYVYGETDDADAKKCDVSTPSAITTAQAALRAKGVKVANQDDYFNDRALALYITTTVTSSCATVVQVSIQTATSLINPVTKQRHFTTIEFCNESSVMTGSDLQNRINADVVTLLGACMDKYTKSIRAN